MTNTLNNTAGSTTVEETYRVIVASRGQLIKVSVEDYEHLSQMKWFIRTNNGYAARNDTIEGLYFDKKNNREKPRQRTILMHRYILGLYNEETIRALGRPSSMIIVDHINGDKLDNRRCNLRIGTHAQNLWNPNNRVWNNTTGVRGIWKTKYNTFSTYINVNKKSIYLGTYKTLEQAINVRKAAEEKYYTL